VLQPSLRVTGTAMAAIAAAVTAIDAIPAVAVRRRVSAASNSTAAATETAMT
jgi:hypothetical protein